MSTARVGLAFDDDCDGVPGGRLPPLGWIWVSMSTTTMKLALISPAMVALGLDIQGEGEAGPRLPLRG
jgi:hypothetical protein